MGNLGVNSGPDSKEENRCPPSDDGNKLVDYMGIALQIFMDGEEVFFPPVTEMLSAS